jgi:hypothetical protein
VYLAMSPGARDAPVTVEGHYLDGNVPAVLEEITVPRFQRL